MNRRAAPKENRAAVRSTKGTPVDQPGVTLGRQSAAPTAQPQWKRICLVTDIPVLGARRVARARGMDVALFRNDQDQVFALLDRCPHKGGPLSQGIVFGTSVACPLHNWTIDLSAGCAQAPDEGCTQPFSVRVDDGQVFLDGAELAQLAVEATAPVAGPAHRITLVR